MFCHLSVAVLAELGRVFLSENHVIVLPSTCVLVWKIKVCACVRLCVLVCVCVCVSAAEIPVQQDYTTDSIKVGSPMLTFALFLIRVLTRLQVFSMQAGGCWWWGWGCL